MRELGVGSDVRAFLLHRPEVATLVDSSDRNLREEYSRRIKQRLGIDVTPYTVLNIHRIGIDAPVSLVFDELRGWSGESPYWPNRLATVESLDPERRSIKILLFGRSMCWLRRRRLLPADFGTLFNLGATRIQADPDPRGLDNARFVLYACSGGYPIGIFAMYVRSAVAELGESEATQVFFCVSFDFYGLKGRLLDVTIGWLWEAVHNRATGNILCRFKAHCESMLGRLAQEMRPASGP
jgi:hypothetical protein